MSKQEVAGRADVIEPRQAGTEASDIGACEPQSENETADLLRLFAEIKVPRRRKLILELLRESAKLG